MRFTLSRSASLTSPPGPWDVTWDDLAAGLTSDPYRTEAKDGAPLWAPCELDGRGRPVQVHLAVFDLDSEDPRTPGAPPIRVDQVAAVLERLRARGIAFAAHGTWSAHKAGDARTKGRVVIPLARPVPAAGWKATWETLRAEYAPEADPQCKDAGRRFFAPSCPPGAPEGSFWAVTVPGSPLEPPTPQEAALGAVELADRRVHREELGLLARAWKRRLDTARHGIALKAVIDGLPYAEAGERDAETWALCRALALALPDASAADLAAHFAPSLSLMGADAPTVANVADKITRARRDRVERDATPPPAPPSPHVLVTPVGSLYFVRGAEEHSWDGPYGGDAVDLAIARHLEGAPGVSLYAPSASGPVPKARGTILRDYGERVSRYGVELGASRHAYDPTTRTLTEAAAVPRALGPLAVHEEELAREYLSHVAGGDPKIYRDLHTWLARLPDLTDTLAAVVLLGAPGLGKGLFAAACSRLWTTDGPTDADDAFGTWNDSILRCPLIFADEKLPETWRGKDLSAEIRKILASRTTPIRRRFTPTTNARGCVRMILAANNDEILSFSGASTEDDIRAISERFYVVRLKEEAMRPFFAAHPRAHDALVGGDVLAKYARSLAADPAARVGRFWIVGPTHDAERIAIRAGAVFNLLSWVVQWLQHPENLTNVDPKAQSCVSERGEILVSLGEIGVSWQRYFPGENPPERTRLAHAARAVGEQNRSKSGRLWRIKPAYVDAWIRDSGWSCPSVGEMIESRMRRPALRVV